MRVERGTIVWEYEYDAFGNRITTIQNGEATQYLIDPIGLGQNFSPFMHLVDFDEKLVTHRIWTEGTHITQRLTDLTEHMEDVIQTYLRNEFKPSTRKQRWKPSKRSTTLKTRRSYCRRGLTTLWTPSTM